MNKRTLLFLLVSILIIATIGLVGKYKQPVYINHSGKLEVAASFYPLYFFAQEIGGAKAEVVNITPAGAEPHDYEPTAKDMAILEKSKLVILIGNDFEPWSANLQLNKALQSANLIEVGDNLASQQAEAKRKGTDPHIWLSPAMAQKIVDEIAQGFLQVDPSNKDYYQANAEALKSKLISLDDDYRRGLAKCGKKEIITSHAAFGYLVQNYGLKQLPIAGLSPDNEPSPQQLADIAKFARENRVEYIFFESLVSPKLAQTLADEVGAKTLVLNPLEGLSKQELASGKNYFTEMRNNLVNLRTALRCQ